MVTSRNYLLGGKNNVAWNNEKWKFYFTLSPTLNPSWSPLGSTEAEEAVLNPGLGIFEADGNVPIPEDEDVEAAEVGLGKWLILAVLVSK